MAENSSVSKGMANQIRRLREAIDGGMPRVGWKVALAAPAAMERYGLSAPAVAWLNGYHNLPPGGEYVQPEGAKTSIEAELAVRVGEGGLIDAAAPAMEIIDTSRPGDSIEELLGHCVYHDAVVFGPSVLFMNAAQQWPPSAWPKIAVNGAVAAEVNHGMVPKDLNGLLRTIAPQLEAQGESFEEGDWVITGSLTTPVQVSAGDEVLADFGPLGQISVRVKAG